MTPDDDVAAPTYAVSLTGAGTLVVVVGVLTLVAGLQGGSPGLAVAGTLALALVVVSFVLRPSMGWGVVLDPPVRSVEGEAVEHLGVVTLSGRASAPPALLVVHTDGYPASTLALAPMRPGETREVSLVQRPRRRGRTRWVDLTLSTDAPFGLVRRTVHARRPLAALVHPARREPLLLPSGGGAGEAPSGAPDRRGEGFHALRDHRPGDAARDLHRRGTAKRGTPVVVERERLAGDDVVVVLAGPSGPTGTDGAWERLVGSAAWSLAGAVHTGRRARLLVAGPDGLREAPAGDAVAVLDALCLADDVAPLRGEDVRDLAAGVAAGTGVVVFAPRERAAQVRGWVVESFAAAGRPATVVTG